MITYTDILKESTWSSWVHDLQTLTARDDMFRDPVMTESIAQQFIHEVVIRLEVLCNCCVIQLLHSLRTSSKQQVSDFANTKIRMNAGIDSIVFLWFTSVVTPCDYPKLEWWVKEYRKAVITFGESRNDGWRNMLSSGTAGLATDLLLTIIFECRRGKYGPRRPGDCTTCG